MEPDTPDDCWRGVPEPPEKFTYEEGTGWRYGYRDARAELIREDRDEARALIAAELQRRDAAIGDLKRRLGDEIADKVRLYNAQRRLIETVRATLEDWRHVQCSNIELDNRLTRACDEAESAS